MDAFGFHFLQHLCVGGTMNDKYLDRRNRHVGQAFLELIWPFLVADRREPRISQLNARHS